MSIGTILLVLLILVLVGVLPVYPYSRAWGGVPSGVVALLLVLVVVGLVTGRL